MSGQPSSSPLAAEARDKSGDARVIWLGAISFALAGAAIGIIDGLWSFRALGQFLPSMGGKLVLLIHLACSYAFAGAFLGAALGSAHWLLHQHTQWTSILHFLAGREPGAPAPPLTRLSHALAGPPILALATSSAFWNAQHLLLTRKHAGLVIAATMAITLLALVLASMAVLVVARILRALGRPLQGMALPSSPVAIGAALLLSTAMALVPMYKFWLGRLGPLPFSQLWTVPLGLLLLIALPVALPLVQRALSRREGATKNYTRRPLALVLVGMPLIGLSLAAAFLIGAKGIETRTIFVIARSMGLLFCSLSLALFFTLVFALVLDGAWSGSKDNTRRSMLDSPRAAYGAAFLLIALGGSLAAVVAWKTISLLPLRPLWVVLAALVLSIGTRRMAEPWAKNLVVRRVSRSLPIAALSALLLFVLVLTTGGRESVRKASVLHTGLSAPLTRAYRVLGDWDRDGYSRWLGGGDCDDSNARVHPNADEIPFDGIDNNCLRGDVSKRTANATEFAEVPAGLPADFNVILITIDTIRADHLGAYGYERNTTPNIDALADSGTLFLNGWAHAPSTRYSIPALLTGRYPLNVSYAPIPGQWPGLQEKNLTIAEVLKGQGLTTGAILNYWYFDKLRKMNQGFDHYDNENRRLHKAVRGSGPSKTSGTSAKEQSDKALAYIDKHESERFFMWVHYYDPHFDYETHEGTPTFGTSKIDAYDHEIAFTDQQIGRLLDHLKERGLDDKTVIVLTGDHGEGFGEHGIDLHGYHLYAAQTKVPFIMRVPGAAPSVVQMPASHVDVLPTLANLSGAPSDAAMLGQSLVGVISGSADPEAERYIFQQLSYENNNEYRGAASSKCHILYNVSPNLSWELYRIDQDPMEERDIVDSPGECAGARAILETWYDHSEIPEGAAEALLPKAPALENSISVDYANSIRLQEFKSPQKVRRGESIEIEYTWAGIGSPPRGWKVFAHFEAPGGGRFTDDHQPPRPFSWWQKGQHIRYRRTLQISKSQRPGIYQLWFGLYKGSDRLSPKLGKGAKHMTVEDRRLMLRTIEVVP